MTDGDDQPREQETVSRAIRAEVVGAAIAAVVLWAGMEKCALGLVGVVVLGVVSQAIVGIGSVAELNRAASEQPVWRQWVRRRRGVDEGCCYL